MTEWKLVPKQTTLEMRIAGSTEADKMLVNYTNGLDVQRWWNTILAAAPSPTEDIDLDELEFALRRCDELSPVHEDSFEGLVRKAARAYTQIAKGN